MYRDEIYLTTVSPIQLSQPFIYTLVFTHPYTLAHVCMKQYDDYVITSSDWVPRESLLILSYTNSYYRYKLSPEIPQALLSTLSVFNTDQDSLSRMQEGSLNLSI
jgi:hypothetical protein